MSSEGARQKRNRILSWVINLGGILAFGLVLYLGGIEALERIVNADWRLVLIAFVLTLAWNLVATFRWSIIADELVRPPQPIPYRYYYTYQMIGMFIGQIVPITVGMLGGRPVALSLSQGVSLARSALSVFLDKFFDLLLAGLLVTPVVLYLANLIEQPLALGLMGTIALVGAVLVAWQYERSIQYGARTGSRLARPLARLPVIGKQLAIRLPNQMDRLAHDTLLPNHLAIRAFLLTVVMYALLSLRLWLIARALDLDVPWYLMLMGVCVTQLAVVFSVTPGSLGFLEAGWAAVLGLAGLTVDEIAVFVIGRRAFVLVFTLLGTLAAFAWIRESPAQLFRAVLSASREPDRARAEDKDTRDDKQVETLPGDSIEDNAAMGG